MVLQREWHAATEVRRCHGGYIEQYREVIRDNPSYPSWVRFLEQAETLPSQQQSADGDTLLSRIFLRQAQCLGYTDSYATRVGGVWNVNQDQGEMRAVECFCSELVADAYIEFQAACGWAGPHPRPHWSCCRKVFENVNTNDILPVHFAEDHGP